MRRASGARWIALWVVLTALYCAVVVGSARAGNEWIRLTRWLAVDLVAPRRCLSRAMFSSSLRTATRARAFKVRAPRRARTLRACARRWAQPALSEPAHR